MKKIYFGLLISLVFFTAVVPASAKSSKQTLDDSFDKIQVLKTANFTGSFESSIKAIPPKPTKNSKKIPVANQFFGSSDAVMKSTVSGSFDDTDPNHPKVKMNFVMDTGVKKSGFPQTLNLDIVKDSLVYYVFWNLPQSNLTTPTAFDFSAFANKWIKFDLTGLLSDLKEIGLTKLDGNKLDEQALKKGVLKSFKDNKVLTVTKLEDVKNFQGVPARHLKVVINRNGYKNFMIDYAKLSGKPMNAGQKKQVTADLAQLQFLPCDIYIEKSTGFPLFISFGSVEKTKFYNKTTKMNISLSDFNKPVEISAPGTSFSIEELFNQFQDQLKKTASSTSGLK